MNKIIKIAHYDVLLDEILSISEVEPFDDFYFGYYSFYVDLKYYQKGITVKSEPEQFNIYWKGYKSDKNYTDLVNYRNEFVKIWSDYVNSY